MGWISLHQEPPDDILIQCMVLFWTSSLPTISVRHLQNQNLDCSCLGSNPVPLASKASMLTTVVTHSTYQNTHQKHMVSHLLAQDWRLLLGLCITCLNTESSCESEHLYSIIWNSADHKRIKFPTRMSWLISVSVFCCAVTYHKQRLCLFSGSMYLDS